MNKRYLLKILIVVLIVVITLYATAWGEETTNIYNKLTPAELYIVIEEIESVWEMLYTEFLLQLIASDFEEPESDDVLNQLKFGMHELEILSEDLYQLMLSKMGEPELLTPKHNI